MDHHTGHTTYRASPNGELGGQLPHIVRVWFVVDATVDTHLLLCIAREPLHKATATSLGTQALLLWKTLRSLPPYVQLHIVKQESHRHQYGNGKGDNQAVHKRTTHLPTLEVPDLGRDHTHLQHILPKPEPHQTPDWVPEDAPYTSHDRAYHYPNPIQHLARVLGNTDSRGHIRELQEKPQISLYHSALRPANVPAHLQKRRIQLLREQLSLFTRVARWLACKHIQVPEGHTRCPCDQNTPENWEHFRKCPLHTGRDTLVGWSPEEALRQREGWPTHSHAHKVTEHLFRYPLVKETTMRGAVTQALHQHLAKHTESSMEAAAHLQLEAVRRAAAQMVHRKHLLLTQTEQLTDPTTGGTCSVSSITMPCMTQTSTNLLRAPHTPISICRPPRHHKSTAEPTSLPRSHPQPPSPAEHNQGHPYVDDDTQDPGNPPSPAPPDPEHAPLAPITIPDPNLLRATLEGRALSTPLGWYRLQESWTKLPVKGVPDLTTPGNGLHETIVDLVLWRARQHAQGQHVWICPIEWGQGLTHDTDTNVTRRGTIRLR